MTTTHSPDTGVSTLARKTLSVIVPCFNEEQVIATTHGEIVTNLSKVDDLRLEIVYVDDGSGDKTLEILPAGESD